MVQGDGVITPQEGNGGLHSTLRKGGGSMGYYEYILVLTMLVILTV